MAEDAKWLADLLWERFKCHPITKDRRGRCSYVVVYAFARTLLRLCRDYEVDPHAIDWVAVLDPDVSREENLRRLEEYFSALTRKAEAPSEEVAEAISLLEQQLYELERALEEAPEEEKPAIREEIEKVRRQLEELRRPRRPRRPPERPPAPATPEDEVWERLQCTVAVSDTRGSCNRRIARSLARLLETIASKLGASFSELLEKVNPDLSMEENIVEILRSYGVEVPRDIVEAARRLTRLIHRARELRSELRLYRPGTTEFRAARSELREVTRAATELRGSLTPRIRELVERLRPPTPPAPPAPPTPPPRPAAPPPSLEEARAAFEYYLKRIPRVYRVDWSDLRARISCHHEVLEQVTRTVEELGGTVERIVRARPPLMIVYADFSRARPPPVPVPPYMERYLLWSKFSAALLAAGLRPEEYREEFDTVYRETEGLPLEERQRRIEELARRIVETARPPPPPAPTVPPGLEEALRRLEERLGTIERELRELRGAVAWRPSTAEELRLAFEAAWLAEEPRLTLRVDEAGHTFIGPDDKTLSVLAQFLDRWALAYFMSCPICRRRLPGGGLGPVDFVEHLINVEHKVPPIAIDYLRKLARMLEEAEALGRVPG